MTPDERIAMEHRLKDRKSTKRSLYYLNDYCNAKPSLRIESTRGGERCLWRARTTIKKMEETKRYLDKCWGLG